ncbi:MAG: glycosyltransferase family 39 protein [Thermoanaerobaculia bacterium]
MPPRRVLFAAILAAGAAVRVYRLDHFSYNLDEMLQTYWIHGSWSFLWQALTFDAFHPPLDYVLGRVLEPLGPSDPIRKLLPVLWGTAGIAAFGRLLARRAGETAGLVGAALLAFAPYHVRYSQELRPYALGLLLLTASLLLLDRFLERPGVVRLAALFLASLATAYALYLAAAVLALAAAALVAEDAFAEVPARRRAARRFAAWSPVFVLGLWLAYLPWWPVLRTAMLRPPMEAPAPATLSRFGRVLGFFAFAPNDHLPLGVAGWLFVALLAGGLWFALAARNLRVFAVWGIGGLVLIEILGRMHPHFDVSRRFLPAGLGLTALAALALTALIVHPAGRLAGAALLTAVLVLDARSLRVYFREGRADWRPLGEHLRRETGPTDRIFTENQYAQLCTAFYVVGPGWLSEAMEGIPQSRSIVSLDGDGSRLGFSWRPGTRGWLVLAGVPESPSLRRWARNFPSVSFPTAGGAVVHRLDMPSPSPSPSPSPPTSPASPGTPR